MPPLSFLIKPSSGMCNMRCKYCFYSDVTEHRDVGNRGFMTIATAKNIAKEIFDVADSEVNISFQGGEPTLIGLEFFEQFIEIMQTHNTKGLKVSYGMQTNGTNINAGFCEFYKKHNFLVGVSLDGNREIHDFLRSDNGSGSYNSVLKGIRLLEKYGVEYNILTVVSKFVARHYQKIYSEYKRLNFKYLQFIPCLDAFDANKQDFSLTAKDYGTFLSGLFDLWLRDYESNNYVSIRLFDNLINRINGNNTELCGLNGFCSIQNVIESDGTVYPCDFYCLDEYEMGNINEKGFKELFYSAPAKSFLARSRALPESCTDCQYVNLCRGGCKRERINNSNILCESYKSLFKRIEQKYKSTLL